MVMGIEVVDVEMMGGETIRLLSDPEGGRGARMVVSAGFGVRTWCA